MRCPFCAHDDSQVKDSRPTEDGTSIRRRRQCSSCGARFTTFERVQLREVVVVKSGDRREPFERQHPVMQHEIADGVAAGMPPGHERQRPVGRQNLQTVAMHGADPRGARLGPALAGEMIRPAKVGKGWMCHCECPE